MKIKIVIISSFIFVFSLISCEKDSEEIIDSKATYSIQIDGVIQDINDATGYLNNKFYYNDNDQFTEGLRVTTSIGLEDNTLISVVFNNNDLSAENVVLGDYTDAIKLVKCDVDGTKISAEFDAILTNKENNETIHVIGSFTDVSLIVSL